MLDRNIGLNGAGMQHRRANTYEMERRGNLGVDDGNVLGFF